MDIHNKSIGSCQKEMYDFVVSRVVKGRLLKGLGKYVEGLPLEYRFRVIFRLLW